MGADAKTYLSVYHDDKGTRGDITNEDISRALKVAATVLDYPNAKGIPIDRIDMHSLRSGGANALSLAGYSDTQIQKMGRWRGATFKEYIHEELACFLEGMSTSMKKQFNFIESQVMHSTPSLTFLLRGNMRLMCRPHQPCNSKPTRPDDGMEHGANDAAQQLLTSSIFYTLKPILT
jgi:hypothetical protein